MKEMTLANMIKVSALIALAALSLAACDHVDPAGVRTPPEIVVPPALTAATGADVTAALALAHELPNVEMRGSLAYDTGTKELSDQSCEVVRARPATGEFSFDRDDNTVTGVTCEEELDASRGTVVGNVFYYIPGEGENLDGKWRRFEIDEAIARQTTGILTTLPRLRQLLEKVGEPTSADQDGVRYSVAASDIDAYLLMGDGVLRTEFVEVTEPVILTVTLDENRWIASYSFSIPDPSSLGASLVLRRSFHYDDVVIEAHPEAIRQTFEDDDPIETQTIVFFMGARVGVRVGGPDF